MQFRRSLVVHRLISSVYSFQPIMRREPDIDTYVDASTERMILEKTQRMRSVWDRPGLLASSDF